MIRMYNVSVSFSEENKALDNVNLKIREGEFLYITGGSGAGKSTLLRLIYADLMPTKGVVMFEGQNVGMMSKGSIPYLRRNVGVVFQDFKLLESKTVYENVKMALEIFYLDKKSMRERIFPLLKKLGIFAKRDCEVMNLSGGEKQRVAIARALINEPKVIIADEPTGNLDWENSARIMDLLMQSRATGATVLVATHDNNLMQRFPARRIHLSFGKVSRDIKAGETVT